MMAFKIAFGSELRRFALDKPSFESILERVRLLYPTIGHFRLTWTDHENDQVTLASDEDLQVALAEGTNNNSLRLTLIPSPSTSSSSTTTAQPMITKESTTEILNIPAMEEEMMIEDRNPKGKEPDTINHNVDTTANNSSQQPQPQQQREEQFEEEREQYDEQGRIIHPHITCDGCNRPLTGIRYKCAECDNFDLCEECEAKNEHPAEHVVLKIRKPTRVEIFTSFRTNRFGGGRRGRGRGWAHHRDEEAAVRWAAHCARRWGDCHEPKPSTEQENQPSQPSQSDDNGFRYSSELQLLHEMGFFNDEINLQLLNARSGRVDLVVEQLTKLSL